MSLFVLRRLLSLIITLAATSVVVFGVLELLPGNAAQVILGDTATPEAVGDYVGGPNHVLPTGRRARFSSGLSVLDFMKRTSFLGCTPAAIQAIGPAAVALAHAEGLPAHARSVQERLTK